MAELYLSYVREIRPHGPYRLLGYSMGSKIACEMARRLEAMGESVELVALLDIAAVVPEGFAAEEAEVPSDIRELPDFDGEITRRHLDVLHANRRASLCWSPKVCLVKAMLFVTAKNDVRAVASEDPALGWGAVAPRGVEVIRVPGDHSSMLQAPYVQTLVKRLTEQERFHGLAIK